MKYENSRENGVVESLPVQCVEELEEAAAKAGVDVGESSSYEKKSYDDLCNLIAYSKEINLKKIRELIQLFTNVNKKGGNERTTPLLYAVGRNKLTDLSYVNVIEREVLKELVELLINQGADVNVVHNRITPLMYVIRSGYADIAELLIDSGANVNNNKEVVYSPLVEAIRMRNPEMVKLLLLAGADVNSDKRVFYNPLVEAIKVQHLEIVKLLLAAGADVNAESEGETAWVHALKGVIITVGCYSYLNYSKLQNIIGLFIEAGAVTNLQEESSFRIALCRIILKLRSVTNVESTYTIPALELLVQRVVEVSGNQGEYDERYTKLAEQVLECEGNSRPLKLKYLCWHAIYNSDDIGNKFPCKLTELCRSAIREQINYIGGNMLYALKRLNLPTPLQKYLIFDYNINTNLDKVSSTEQIRRIESQKV